MKILYIGDIMNEPGLKLIERELPILRQEKGIDVVIAQAENVTNGKGISVSDFKRLQKAGVDMCSGGNWTLHNDEIFAALNNPDQPIVRPANYPKGTPGVAYKYAHTATGSVLVVSLLGSIVGKDAHKPMDNPLQVIDTILEQEKDVAKVATVVNFHGDYSSEKVVVGYYLDGKVTAVLGDHWHVPTADAKVLPQGTAHMSDVGMCGVLHSSLGVKTQVIIDRWRNGKVNTNHLETEGPFQFNAALIAVQDGLAISIEHIQRIID